MSEQRPSKTPLPCPHCKEPIADGEDSWYFRGDGPPPSYAVRCDSCGAQGPYGNGKFRNDHAGAQARAIELWNDRVAPEPTPADEPSAALTDDEIAAIGSKVTYVSWLTDLLDDDKWNNTELGLLEFARAIEARCRAAVPPNDADREDAERWRALINCDRITAMGSAGIENHKGDGYAHLTVNLWTKHPTGETETYPREWLRKFVDIARGASTKNDRLVVNPDGAGAHSTGGNDERNNAGSSPAQPSTDYCSDCGAAMEHKPGCGASVETGATPSVKDLTWLADQK